MAVLGLTRQLSNRRYPTAQSSGSITMRPSRTYRLWVRWKSNSNIPSAMVAYLPRMSQSGVCERTAPATGSISLGRKAQYCAKIRPSKAGGIPSFLATVPGHYCGDVTCTASALTRFIRTSMDWRSVFPALDCALKNARQQCGQGITILSESSRASAPPKAGGSSWPISLYR